MAKDPAKHAAAAKPAAEKRQKEEDAKKRQAEKEKKLMLKTIHADNGDNNSSDGDADSSGDGCIIQFSFEKSNHKASEEGQIDK